MSIRICKHGSNGGLILAVGDFPGSVEGRSFLAIFSSDEGARAALGVSGHDASA